MKLLSIGKNLTAGTETVVYTVPDGYIAIWDLMYLHNSSGSTKNITVDWYDVSEGTHVSILSGYSMGSKAYFQLSGAGSGVVLEAGDEIHMTSEAGSAFGIICTVRLERV